MTNLSPARVSILYTVFVDCAAVMLLGDQVLLKEFEALRHYLGTEPRNAANQAPLGKCLHLNSRSFGMGNKFLQPVRDQLTGQECLGLALSFC